MARHAPLQILERLILGIQMASEYFLQMPLTSADMIRPFPSIVKQGYHSNLHIMEPAEKSWEPD